MIENQGRINYGHMNDPKGLVSNVTINGVILTNWTAIHVDGLPKTWRDFSNDLMLKTDDIRAPAFFKGTVPPMPEGQAPQDTYLLLNGWSKVCRKALRYRLNLWAKTCMKLYRNCLYDHGSFALKCACRISLSACYFNIGPLSPQPFMCFHAK